MKIILLNRQRLHKVNLPKLQNMAEILAQEVFNNLKRHPPKTAWTKILPKIETDSSINLIIASPNTMRKLNKDWRQEDKETDVLSFPLIDAKDFPQTHYLVYELEGNIVRNKAIKAEDTFELGEIFISYQQAIEQAEEYEHSLEREMAFLFVHGLLHILGFDHQDKLSEKEMFGRQRKILEKAKYFRQK